MADNTTSGHTLFRLLDLPAELRNRIYHFAVVNEKPIDIIHHKRWRRAEALQQPALASTCKQLRKEVLPIFYGGNSFVLDTVGDIVQDFKGVVRAWMKACGPYLSYIKSIGVSAYYDQEAEDYEESGALQSLECYLTVTLLGPGDWVEIWLGGDLEDQCICSLEERDWSRVLGRRTSDFIRLAMCDCREDFKRGVLAEVHMLTVWLSPRHG
jgi:hypothetical protein